ncbi:MAG: SDR family NAD(P)-dependent oxidoreductase [Nitrospira sp.]|nr:SDR family NAD(P)-dependent oxidoreductase [Nitrospira sp.]
MDRNSGDQANEHDGLDIAVIGLACRFPGSYDSTAFWTNLRDGVESITALSEEDLRSAGVQARLRQDPSYVRMRGIIDGIDLFDADFFGVTPKEAESMDPQHRLFLECAWETFEHAGYDPERFHGSIGVYAGSSTSGYLFNLFPDGVLLQSASDMARLLGVEKDSLPTRVSYKLNLEGPSIAVQTACSTSLVAVHLACQGLLAGECDMALAGGISVNVPQAVGYLYQKSGIASPDGHCRAFDADARGTVGGSGVGIVLLKRLDEARIDRDHILAVIKGTAINNDGAHKVGYTAPRVEGQAKVIRAAHVAARVESESIRYVEAHGTGTPMGDPIEVAALTQAFRAGTDRNGFCAIGSVKTNIGHLDAAAGIAGLIKTALALSHKQIPPSLHFSSPNSEIDFAETPFYVNTKLTDWNAHDSPRRAGVSSFGIGGTNAHVIMEEAPPVEREPHRVDKRPRLVVLSAKSEATLNEMTARLVVYLQQQPAVELPDVVYTLQTGRRAFSYRRWVVADNVESATRALSRHDSVKTIAQAGEPRPVVFLFSGQGAQYCTMGRGLYAQEPIFREQADRCAALLVPHIGTDIKSVLFDEFPSDPERLHRTALTQPALFVLEYALAKLWMSLNVHPAGMIGHSIGEYVAACLSGVFSLEDALRLVAARGRLMQSMPPGSMLAVSMSEADATSLLHEDLDLAAVNAPSQCVLSGSEPSIKDLQETLTKKGVQSVRLQTSHAFHSRMMDPILESFNAQVAGVARHAPTIPWISNVTGDWIMPDQAMDPSYWADHLRRTVRFTDGIETLCREPERILLEVGPGQTLCTLARRQIDGRPVMALASLSKPRDGSSSAFEPSSFLEAVGQLWATGVAIDWAGLYCGERPRRLPLPTYPFERRRFWVEPVKPSSSTSQNEARSKKPNISDWFYEPSWRRSRAALPAHPIRGGSWLVFVGERGEGIGIVEQLESDGRLVVTVSAGERYERHAKGRYSIRPGVREDYHKLIEDLRRQDPWPDRLVHCWNVRPRDGSLSVETFRRAQNKGLYSLLFLSQALGSRTSANPTFMCILTVGLHDVTGEETLRPELAPIVGACRVIPQEYGNLTCRVVDLQVSTPTEEALTRSVIAQLLAEDPARQDEPIVAYRGMHRWIPTFQPVKLDHSDERPALLRARNVYLITGGLGGVGLQLADYLVRTVKARLVLIGRSKPTEGQVQQLKTLEQVGGEILTIQANVADEPQMRFALAQALDRFGAVHGVIHAAGVPGGGLIDLKTAEAVETEFAPKVIGALVLDHVLRKVPLDFICFCSSLNALTGGVGQVGYCAANATLDAMAHALSKRGSRVVSVNFDRWNEVGMAVQAEARLKTLQIDASEFDGMAASEAQDVFGRILHGWISPQAIVSVRDCSSLVMQGAGAALLNVVGITAKGGDASQELLRGKANQIAGAAIEDKVTFVWQHILGIERIGLHDDFFTLGGESLAALQILNRVQELFGTEISLKKFFEHPTVAGLSEQIRCPQKGGITAVPDIVPLPRKASSQRMSSVHSGGAGRPES